MKIYRVLEGLYISGKFNDESELNVYPNPHFDVIINLWHKADNLTMRPIGSRMYIHWPMRDGKISKQENFILPLVNIICELLDSNKKILIHCYGGRNRSALLAALVVKRYLCNIDVIKYMHDIRKSTLKNEHFQGYLMNDN